MREIEKAIQQIEDMAYHSSLKTNITTQSMCVILKALQEKAERDTGCDICNNHKPLLSLYTEYSIEVEGNEMSVWNGLKCEEIFKINHCPMCGRKLVEE